ncbi:Selenoprotein S [Schistosoma mansoni]|uniref:Selenoprotein S n=2 Tax=Schistosoma TaxID=6181 RepID=G4LW66_SCHMA|nr:Selenoprotein S [Schistosoma mansoni]|eukprot:XP_018645512.1 Selenoprotein S [Schistosoma mansoni]
MDFPAPEVSPQTNFNYGLVTLFIIALSYFLWKFFRSWCENSSTVNNESHRLAMEAARAKFQAEFNAEVTQHKSRNQDEGEGKSNVRKSTDSDEKKKRFRTSDYNPLMGDTGKTYRPTSRFCSTGG